MAAEAVVRQAQLLEESLARKGTLRIARFVTRRCSRTGRRTLGRHRNDLDLSYHSLAVNVRAAFRKECTGTAAEACWHGASR
jgi:hypothetical protein